MRAKYLVCWVALAGFSITTVGCANKAASRTKKGELVNTIDTVNAETSNYIEFDGIGAADQSVSNITQKRSLSEAAGRKIAEEKLLAYLKGQQIDANTTVEQAITTDQRIQGVASNSLRGAQIVKREWTNDDGCVVTIRLDKKKFIDQIKEVRGK